MNDETRQKLSAYLDGALPAEQARALEQELAGSPELARELAALQAVSRLIKDLPREPLPAGFLQRLQRRRAAQDAPAASRNWVFLAPAYRPFAAALSGLIVAIVVWDKVGERSEIVAPYDGVAVKTAAEAPPAQFDFSRQVSGAKSAPLGIAGVSAPEFHPPSVKIPEDKISADMVARRENARAKGSPMEEAAAPAPKLDGGSAVAAVRGAGRRAPSEEERSARNEELYRAFEQEKRKLGVLSIVSRDEVDERARKVLAAASRLDQPARVGSLTPALLAKNEAPAPAVVLRSADEHRAAWSSLKLPGAPSPVDFAKFMVVLLPEPGAVLSAEATASTLVVTWHPTPQGGPSERLRTVALSPLPVRLIRKDQ